MGPYRARYTSGMTLIPDTFISFVYLQLLGEVLLKLLGRDSTCHTHAALRNRVGIRVRSGMAQHMKRHVFDHCRLNFGPLLWAACVSKVCDAVPVGRNHRDLWHRAFKPCIDLHLQWALCGTRVSRYHNERRIPKQRLNLCI